MDGPTPKKFRLSKSRIMLGLQCPKSLYLTVHQPELAPEVSASQQAIFDQGHVVGSAAQREFPGGIAVEAPYYDTAAAVAETEKAIQNGAATIFEATFATETIAVKVDVLHRETLASPWQLIEVKSSTSVKPENITDVAIQAKVITECGHSYEQAYVMHLNNKSTAPELKELFHRVDVTTEIQSVQSGLPAKIASLHEILAKPTAPDIGIGPHCSAPYECPFMAHCWKHIPAASIFEIPGIGKKAWDLYGKGIVEISDPKFVPTKGIQTKRAEAVRTGTRWVDAEVIAAALAEWEWPLRYLDFETIGFAIPRYPGTRPYQQTPFQFSCLAQESVGAPVQETFYLHDEETDPRRPLLIQLVKSLEGKGSIVSYNMGFEAGCMSALAEAFPEYRPALENAISRLVDPLPIFRGAVYDKAFEGSFSIKSVAPALLGSKSSYEGMVVGDGEAAQRGFLEIISPETSPTRRRDLVAAMLSYCRKDTTEMVDLVKWLIDSSSSPRQKRKAVKRG